MAKHGLELYSLDWKGLHKNTVSSFDPFKRMLTLTCRHLENMNIYNDFQELVSTSNKHWSHQKKQGRT